MRLRATAEQEEIDGVHPENVYEMGLSVCCIDESVDSTSKVLVSVMMSARLPLKLKHYDISRAYFQGIMERLIYTDFRRRMSDALPN